MSDDKWPFPDPRISGVQEHYECIQTFLTLAGESKDPVVIFRLQKVSIYSARSIIEIIREAAKEKQLSFSRDQLDESLPKKLRWYNLIKKIRIHDFHRFGLIPPNPNMKVLFQGGPIELHAKKGMAAYSIQPTGPKIEVTGNSSIKEDRPLINDDGRFYDDETKKCVSIEQILKDFLHDVPAVIDEFKKDLKR